MLTATDVHYLVGLLSQASHPDDVEIELGNFVFDEASISSRDVDVTITVREGDTVTAFKGFEVKAHGRKLGSEGVEQLAAKLNDMPSITDRAIVSASGFSAPAVRKAAKHGVTLYELRDWKPAEGFEHFKCESVPGVITEYSWAEGVNMHLNPGASCGVTKDQLLHPGVTVVAGDKAASPTKPLSQWLQEIQSRTAQEAQKRVNAPGGVGVYHQPAKVTLSFTDNPRIEGPFGTLYVRAIEVRGFLETRTRALPSVYKALFKLSDPKPLAGCCVSDAGPLGLLGLIVSENREIRLISVPIAARNKTKIFREKLIRSELKLDELKST